MVELFFVFCYNMQQVREYMKELDNLISRINIMEQTLSNEWSDDEFLFHALRFQPLEKLESIIKTGYIFPASQVTRKFSSYDGTIKNIHLYDYDDNCNLGKFVSLMPDEEESLEFMGFIKSNLFLELKRHIPVFKPIYLSYSDYSLLIKYSIKTNLIYSYSLYELMTNKPISFDFVRNIGVYSNYYDGDISSLISSVKSIMDYYALTIPFYDYSTDEFIYQKK